MDSVQADRKPLVLYVDFDSRTLQSSAQLLERYGCHVLRAYTAGEALRILVDYPIQIVICDDSVPDMGGSELLRRAKLISPATSRIMLSRCYDPQVVIRAVNKAEVFRLLAKPFSEQDIQTVVADALGAPPRVWGNSSSATA